MTEEELTAMCAGDLIFALEDAVCELLAGKSPIGDTLDRLRLVRRVLVRRLSGQSGRVGIVTEQGDRDAVKAD